MTTMNNKYYSERQEKMVANYMGWRVVPGSGARPFTPGDVNSYNFLVECKTHTTETHNVAFYKKHWVKIQTEARSKYRRPVLITDNGTQLAEYTWVAIPLQILPIDNANAINCNLNQTPSDNTIVFAHSDALEMFKNSRKDDVAVNYLLLGFGDDEVAVMPLEEFRHFYRQEYET